MQLDHTLTQPLGNKVFKMISGTFMIAGTAVGAGMLGIPLVTGVSGFIPACLITTIVWAFMLSTGLLFLEASLWMPSGSNVLSITEEILGKRMKLFSGFMFLFLYYCLVIAYIAAGAPFLRELILQNVGADLGPTLSYLAFSLIIGSIIATGARSINRVNILLSAAMGISFILIIGTGTDHISEHYLTAKDYSMMAFAVPMLFGAFGFHNVIPSLVSYLERDKWVLRSSIILGSTLALATYIIWQYIVIGSVSLEAIAGAHQSGQTATHALEEVSANPALFVFAKYFSLFALLTSLLGVSFSMVDFYADGFKQINKSPSRPFLCLLIFLPSLGCVLLDPEIFSKALSIAGGFGEAFLNGCLPVMLVWTGRYFLNKEQENAFFGKGALVILFIGSTVAMLLEAIHLLKI